MLVMGHNLLSPQPKKFRWLMYISPVLAILSLSLLLWIYTSNETFQYWTQYYRATSEPQILVHPTSTKHGPGERVPFVAVKGTKTLLVSAYLEHRTGQRKVRLIAVVLRKEKVAYRCLLLCQDQLFISEGVSLIHSDHFGFAYGTADIICPLPSNCRTPSHITVTSAADYSEDTHKYFLEVKNQKAQSDSFAYNFTVCISTMYDYTNVLQMVQTFEMLKLLGVNRVVVYKTSCSPETQRILDYYIDKGLVEVIPFSLSGFLNVSRRWLPSQGPGDLHYFGQITAINDCVYKHMYQSRYVAIHDMDELILAQSVKSWLELLHLLEKKYGADKCYQFQNNVFPNTFTPPPNSQFLHPESCCPSWQNVPGVNILAHLYQEPTNTPKSYTNFKIIVNPRAVFSSTVHGLLSSLNDYSFVDRKIARIYHTRPAVQTQLRPNQLIYDGRLLSYSAQLIPNVDTVLRESGLLREDNLQ